MTAGPSSPAGCFQVKLAGAWRDVEPSQDAALKRAYMAGLDIVPCKVGCHRYQVDFRKMTQTNMASSKTRPIRPPRGWKGDTSEKSAAPKLRVRVPEGTAGTCIYVPDPRTAGQFIAVQVPAAARAGASMLVPLPPATPATPAEARMAIPVAPPMPATPAMAVPVAEPTPMSRLKPFDSLRPSAPAASTTAPCTADALEEAGKESSTDPQPAKVDAKKWSTGAKVAAGGAAVVAAGGLAVAGLVLGEHVAEVGWDSAVSDVGHAAADVAADAGEFVTEAAHDTGDLLLDLF